MSQDERDTETMMLRACLEHMAAYIKAHRFAFIQLDPNGYLAVEREYDDVAKWTGLVPLSPARNEGAGKRGCSDVP
jgi:hypothetical protein